MHIVWNAFTPWSALAGGLAIGAASGLLVLGSGRIAGISGIAGGLWQAVVGGAGLRGQAVRGFFLLGLLAAPWVWRLAAPLPPSRPDAGWAGILAAGLLVGFGTRKGSGCTSGHGVCGLSRLSGRSLANVLAFMGAGFTTVALSRHVLG